jgi:predicted transposase/invertase (TIGR01784 family)
MFYASLPVQKQAPRGFWDFNLKTVYIVAVLDFVLFDEFEDDKDYVIEHVNLIRRRTKTLYSEKMNFVFVELPKFNKTAEALETNMDKWLFSLKNLSKLQNRPLSVQGKIFEKLFKIAEIKQLTKEDMEAYKKSVLEYQDVLDAVNYARKEGREEGIEEGIKKGIEKGHKEGIEEEKIFIVQKCFQMNIPIDVIVNITGFSKEQIIRYTTNSSL